MHVDVYDYFGPVFVFRRRSKSYGAILRRVTSNLRNEDGTQKNLNARATSPVFLALVMAEEAEYNEAKTNGPDDVSRSSMRKEKL